MVDVKRGGGGSRYMYMDNVCMLMEGLAVDRGVGGNTERKSADRRVRRYRRVDGRHEG